jgi:hypothetical protein
MLKASSHSLVLCFTLATTAAAQHTCLTTLFAQNNGGSPGGNVYFDVEVTNPAGVTVTDFEVNTLETGIAIDLNVYITPGTSFGNQTNAAAWTLVASGTGMAMGGDVPSPVDTSDFNLAAGTYGMALESGVGVWSHRYTSTALTVSNADLMLDLGSASNAPFSTPIFEPRTWNGSICYQPGVVECFLIVGLEPVNVPLGTVLSPWATNQDVLLVNPIMLTYMSLTNLPEVPVPSHAPLGASIYTQGLLMNPVVFGNDPIKLSQAIEWQVGVSTTPFGNTSGLYLWSTSPPAVMPGQPLTMSFTIL